MLSHGHPEMDHVGFEFIAFPRSMDYDAIRDLAVFDRGGQPHLFELRGRDEVHSYRGFCVSPCRIYC
jgi:hypothetical protein